MPSIPFFTLFSFKIDFEIERGEGGEDTYIGDNTKTGMNGIWNE